MALETWTIMSQRLPACTESSSLEFSTIADRDWKEAYKEHFHPWSIDPLHIVPERERTTYVFPDGGNVLYVDPGMAFARGFTKLLACA